MRLTIRTANPFLSRADRATHPSIGGTTIIDTERREAAGKEGRALLFVGHDRFSRRQSLHHSQFPSIFLRVCTKLLTQRLRYAVRRPQRFPER